MCWPLLTQVFGAASLWFQFCEFAKYQVLKFTKTQEFKNSRIQNHEEQIGLQTNCDFWPAKPAKHACLNEHTRLCEDHFLTSPGVRAHSLLRGISTNNGSFPSQRSEHIGNELDELADSHYVCCPNMQPRALLVQMSTLLEACLGETRSDGNSRCICHLLMILCGSSSCVISV